MNSLYIIVGLNILAAFIAFTSTEGLINRKMPNQAIFGRKRKFILTPKGMALALAFLGTTTLSIWQYFEDEDEKRNTKANNEKNLQERDSLAKIDQDRRDSTSYANLAEAFAKYDIKYDSVQRSFERLVKDSSKMTYVSATNPDLFVCPGGIVLKEQKDSSYTFKMTFCNKSAPSTFIKVALYTVLKDDKGKFHGVPGSMPIFANHRRIPAEIELSKEVGITSVLKIEQAFFQFIGTYRNDENNKEFKINDVLVYDFKDKSTNIGGESSYTIMKENLR